MAKAPQGLDSFSADETALIDQMRRTDQGDPPAAQPPASTATQAPAKPAAAPQQVIEITDDAPQNTQQAVTEVELDDDAPGAQEAGDNRSKTVPHQAFHAERERRRAAEAKAAEAEKAAAAAQARFEERLNMLVAAAQAQPQAQPQPAPAAPAEPEIPDVTVDPVGHFKAVAEKTQRDMEALRGVVTGLTQRQQQQAEVAALQRWGASQEAAFEQAEPTYRDAMKHLETSRRAELAAMGITDPNQQAQIIGQDIHAIAAATRQQGGNFAERLYAIATQRGFQKPAAQAQTAAAVPALDGAVQVPQLDPVAQTARLSAGRDNAMTIGSAGTAPPTRLSPAQIANMSDAEFAALTAKLSPEQFRNLMGA